MSERDRGMAIAMLAEAFRLKDMTAATVRIYEKALQAVPVAVLEPMTQRAIATRTFFPKVAELLADAEAVRVEKLAQLTFAPCAVNDGCSLQGWVTVEIDGIKRQARCRCWTAFQEQRAALQLGDQILALPSGQTEDAA